MPQLGFQTRTGPGQKDGSVEIGGLVKPLNIWLSFVVLAPHWLRLGLLIDPDYLNKMFNLVQNWEIRATWLPCKCYKEEIYK